MINWTEEDVKFVCNTMVMPAMDKIMKLVDLSNESNHETLDKIVDTLGRMSHRQAIENSFLKAIIIKHCNIDLNEFNLAREEYFKMYDELNKENNNEEHTH